MVRGKQEPTEYKERTGRAAQAEAQAVDFGSEPPAPLGLSADMETEGVAAEEAEAKVVFSVITDPETAEEAGVRAVVPAEGERVVPPVVARLESSW